MNIRRMIGAAALGAAATSLAFVPGAGAQAPQGPATYAGTSAGEALRLSVFGQELTLGSTLTQVDSTPKASATGAGIATPAFEAGATTASSDGDNGSTDPTCEGPIDQIPGLTIALACSSSAASVGADGPTAAATGTVGRIVVNPVQPLLETPLSEVLGPAEDGLNQLIDALAPVTGPVDEGSGLGIDSTLRELIANLFDGADLVSVTVGDTASATTTGASAVTSECAANGATIDVLGSEALGLAPVIQVVVGEAGTSVVAGRDGGAPVADVNPSLVTVRSPLLPGGEVALEIGQSVEIPIPEPIGTSVISAAAGTTGTDENGLTYATASAVTLDLLNGEALQGGVELELAACSSAAGATAAAPAAPTTTAPRLPTTGGEGPDRAALAAAVVLGGLGLALVRRTRPV